MSEHLRTTLLSLQGLWLYVNVQLDFAGAGDCEGGSVHSYALYNILSLLVPRYSSVSDYWLHVKFITDPDSLLATNNPYRTVQNKIPS